MRPRRALALVALLTCATACGSTVQVTSAGSSAGAGLDGLGSGSLSAPVAGPATSSGSLGAAPSVRGGATAPPAAPNGRAVVVPGGSVTALPTVAPDTVMPGVTRSSVTVGVLAADPQANATLESAGFGAASLGDEPASWRAMADELNARGGLAGRRVTLVFHLVNLTESPSSQGQKACDRFTQDSKVAFVLSGYYYASLHTCLSKRGVPALLGNNYGVDSSLAKSSHTVVAWATPLLDRLAAALPAGFTRMGKLKPGTSVGIFVTDAPVFTRSAALLSAALTRQGVQAVTQTVRDSDSGDYSGATTDASAAVLRFRSANVTEVLFLTHNAFEPTLLMQAAGSQGYRPTYLLSSQQYPNTLVGLVPADQLTGAVGLGWAPAVDLSSGYEKGARAQACLAALKKHGSTYSSPGQVLVGLLACDGFDLAERAAELPGGLASRDALIRNALSTATGFVSAVTIRTAFPDGRRDGVDAYRPMAYSNGCGCFSYTGAATAM